MRLNPSLQALAVPIEGLTLDPKNAREHSARNITAIKASLEKFGQQKPVVVLRNGVVIAGNGTLTAALALGWKELAVVVFKDEVNARAYALADNRTAELATWDRAALAEELAGLPSDIDLESLSLTADDLDLGDVWDSDMERLDKIEADDDAGQVTFKVTCAVVLKEAVKEALSKAVGSMDGVTIA